MKAKIATATTLPPIFANADLVVHVVDRGRDAVGAPSPHIVEFGPSLGHWTVRLVQSLVQSVPPIRPPLLILVAGAADA